MGISFDLLKKIKDLLPKQVGIICSPYGNFPKGWLRSMRGKGHLLLTSVPLELFKEKAEDSPLRLRSDQDININLKRMGYLLKKMPNNRAFFFENLSPVLYSQDLFNNISDIIKRSHYAVLFPQQPLNMQVFDHLRTKGVPINYCDFYIKGAPYTKSYMNKIFKRVKERCKKYKEAVVAVSIPNEVMLKNLMRWIHHLKDKGIQLKHVTLKTLKK